MGGAGTIVIKLSATRYSRGLETYASKKYGDDWDSYGDSRDIAEEFDAWLERQY
jgi:hypothetical protein